MQDEPGLGADEHAAQLFVESRGFLLGDGVNEMGLVRMRADVTGDAQGLLDAVGVVPVGLQDLMAAEIAQAGHVRHADGDVGIEQEAEAARLGIVAAQLQDRVPRPRRAQFFLQLPERARALCEKERPG